MKVFKIFFFSLMLTGFSLSNYAHTNVAVNQIDKITNAYFGLKNALVSGDGTVSQNKAKDLLAELSLSPVKNPDASQQKILATYLEKLKYDTRYISETTVIANQREHFAGLSKNLYTVLQSLKLNTRIVYQQYCPMKKVYWLSESSAIKNPYYGLQMLTCGKITETLNPVLKSH